MEDEQDIVLSLKDKSFCRLSIGEKKQLIDNGRPLPSLKTKVGHRSFQCSWYQEIYWLCASVNEEKLYCWPCLFFKPKNKQSWTDTSYANFKNVLSDSHYHAKSFNHLANDKSWKSFQRLSIECSIDNAFKIRRENHNKLVEENQQYLRHLNNAVLYLSK